MKDLELARSFENNRDVLLQTSNVKNALSFMLDYLQVIKEEEPGVFHIANKAIDSLHTVDKCLDEINTIRRCAVG